MSLQYSIAVRNARLDSLEGTVGVSPTLELRSGAAPINCAAAATGTLICEIQLPTDFMQNADAGSKLMSGTWVGNGHANGVVGYFRLVDSLDVCHIQGSCSLAGNGGDMILDNTNITVNQLVTVNSFTIRSGNA